MKSQLRSLYILVLVMSCVMCSDIPDNGIPDIVSVADSDAFDEALDVSYTLDENFTLDLWAPGPLLANAVALSFDNQGNAYVSETRRRKSSDLDIRQHRDWMTEDIALQSIEDTRAFHLQKLATKLSDENTWQEDFNGDSIHDYRDLEVQSEIVRKIYDSDGDGRADVSHIYTEGMNSMLTGVAAGVLYHNGDVFVTAAPDVYRFKDVDGDGDADTKEVISHGYGIHIAFAGHDMSGLTVGHDGKLYWSIGDIGVNVTDQTGKQWKYPNQGAVMRCNPDGSDFEVFAHGLRNPQELAFDAYGNLISVDNDGDHPGERERYVHILEGSDTGWRINWQYGKYNQPYEEYKIWMDEQLSVPYFEGQAAYITPPLALAPNGPAGLAYNPGTAMDEQWNNYFFGSYFTGNSKRSRINAFQLKPKGASYEIVNEQDVIVGINSTGVNFGPDGSLYVNDWKESYSKKEAGRIWKLDSKTKNALRDETKAILKAGPSELTIAQLDAYLDHPDMRVRQLAQFELVDRNELNTLKTHALKGENEFGRLHAIWGYGQLMRENPELYEDLPGLYKSESEHVRAQYAKVLGDIGKNESTIGQSLSLLLYDESPRVRLHAVEAIGKIGYQEAYQYLVDQLERFEENKDPHMRHAVSYALSKIADDLTLEKLATNESVNVRIGAVLALRHQASAKLSSFLNDKHELVATEAARAINDDFSIPAAMEALAKSLTTSTIKTEAFLRRAINANLRLADKASAERLTAYVLNKEHDDAMRMQALWSVGYWLSPPEHDRVDNRYRELKPGKKQDAHTSFANIYKTIETESNSELKAMIITVAGKLSYTQAEDSVFKYVQGNHNKAIRIAAMASLGLMESSRITEAINIVMEDSDVDLRKEAQKMLNQSNFSDDNKLAIIEKILATATIEEKQTALNALSKVKSEKAITLLASQIKQLHRLEKGIQLDVLTAAKAQENEKLNELVTQYESAKPADDKLAAYVESLYGGDAQKGKNILAFNDAAQCLRCHKIQGYGGEVGPALDKIGAELSREELLLSLVDPNSRIAPGFGSIYFTLTDDTELSGIVETETTTSIVVKDPAGKTHELLKSNIKNQENLPSGMLSQETILKKTEIRDLVEFLVSLK